MAEHNDYGKWGEEYATQYLQKQGYLILERDWRYGKSKRDIDIICKTADLSEVVFVEVKARSNDKVMQPEEAVDRRKIRHLGQAADHYIKLNNITEQVRFDVIAIVGRRDSDNIRLKHIIDAFNPLLL